MPWHEISSEDLAKEWGIDINVVREKQRLMSLIEKTRKEKKLSQAKLAKIIGVTQGRIAQIESGIGTSQVTFDVLFNILKKLGYEVRVVAKKAG